MTARGGGAAYIEMVKDRFIVVDEHSDADRGSARWTLWESYRVVLGSFAPFVTEHMFQRFYQPHEPVKSLHVSTWPTVDEQWVSDRTAMDKTTTVLDVVRALRAQHKLGNAAHFAKPLLDPRTDDAKNFAAAIAEPLRVAARARHVVFEAADHDSGVVGLMVGMVV